MTDEELEAVNEARAQVGEIMTRCGDPDVPFEILAWANDALDQLEWLAGVPGEWLAAQDAADGTGPGPFSTWPKNAEAEPAQLCRMCRRVIEGESFYGFCGEACYHRMYVPGGGPAYAAQPECCRRCGRPIKGESFHGFCDERCYHHMFVPGAGPAYAEEQS